MIDHPRRPLPGVNRVGSDSHTQFGSLYMLPTCSQCLYHSIAKPFVPKSWEPRDLQEAWFCPCIHFPALLMEKKSGKSTSALGLPMVVGYDTDLGIVPWFRRATGDVRL